MGTRGLDVGPALIGVMSSRNRTISNWFWLQLVQESIRKPLSSGLKVDAMFLAPVLELSSADAAFLSLALECSWTLSASNGYDEAYEALLEIRSPSSLQRVAVLICLWLWLCLVCKMEFAIGAWRSRSQFYIYFANAYNTRPSTYQASLYGPLFLVDLKN